ncbi:LysR substrate-binding domain-containing protein [Kineococcus endophyticus]|uniref:LysR substrate-binding domain-containing protein n=1 Tax=Kineococcus endophyticus TaxID=1181883 RepID=A0ABV3PCX1_9ACTN
MIEVREARYFIAVAEELHFGRAAARLHMSQPPLSQTVKGLEQRLGVRLLHRTTREVTLSPAGAALLQRCRELVHTSQAATDAARAAAGGQVGRLRIGAVTSAFLDPLPQVLASFSAEYPSVDVQVREVDTHDAVQAVRRRELDIAVVRQLATPAECVRATLRSEHFVLVVPAAWAPGLTDPEHLAAAATLPWIWLPREISPDYHDQVVACCRAADFAPEARHSARSITSQLAMVACGLGVALVPESAAHQGSLRADVVRLIHLQGSATIDLAAIWRRGADALVNGFIRSARSSETPHTST